MNKTPTITVFPHFIDKGKNSTQTLLTEIY